MPVTRSKSLTIEDLQVNLNITSSLMEPKSTWDCDAQFTPLNLTINLVASEVILCTHSLSLYFCLCCPTGSHRISRLHKILAIRPFKSYDQKTSSLKRNSVEFEGTRRFDSSKVYPNIIDIQTFHRKALLYPLCKGMQEEKLEGED